MLYLQLKEMFPVFDFVLPPKRWFNNFSAEFLEERQLGLQDFLQHLVARKDLRNRYIMLCVATALVPIINVKVRGVHCCFGAHRLSLYGQKVKNMRNIIQNILFSDHTGLE